MPRVSVVITYFDSEHFLAEAIRSVELQDYSDWELLLVNDGSEDGSRRIAEQFESIRVRLLEHHAGGNCGISASRNLGVRHATGEFIALLDSDDIWERGKLRKQVEILDRFPEAAMVYSSALRWYSWSGREQTDEVIWNTSRDCLVEPSKILIDYLRDESLSPCTCTVLVRRAAYESAAGFLDEFPDLYDDQVFFAKLLLRQSAYVMRESTARYRQHSLSTCAKARKSGNGGTTRATFLRWLLDYLPQDETQIRTIAQEELGRLA